MLYSLLIALQRRLAKSLEVVQGSTTGDRFSVLGFGVRVTTQARLRHRRDSALRRRYDANVKAANLETNLDQYVSLTQ